METPREQSWLADALGDRIGWSEDELREMLEHQLQRPMDQEFQRLCIATEPLSSGWDGMTFRELFDSPAPPRDLLIAVKDFAKRQVKQSNEGYPEELGALLYYASIACAFVRAGERIASLDDAALRKGLVWALDHPASHSLRGLFESHLRRLGA